MGGTKDIPARDGVIKSSGGDKPDLGAICFDDRGGGVGNNFVAGGYKDKKYQWGDKKHPWQGCIFSHQWGGCNKPVTGIIPPSPPTNRVLPMRRPN